MVFKSEVSVSFRVVVEFFDSDGIAVCPVIVHATSENSLLTTHMYIRNPIIDFQWSLSIDKRVSRASKTSDSFTDDEEYEVNSYRPVRESSFYKNSRRLCACCECLEPVHFNFRDKCQNQE